jgi:hypothetical protein
MENHNHPTGRSVSRAAYRILEPGPMHERVLDALRAIVRLNI